MKRRITDALIEWKDKKGRKPLIVNGARQVGKSYIIQEFGEAYFDDVLVVNFEIDRDICNFIESDINPLSIIQYLEIHSGKKIEVGQTLLFFDEIQTCHRALTALKYFCEQVPEYHIIAAGSLLGVAINRENFSFPVGKVDQMNLYPMDFEEFLQAVGKEQFADLVREHYLEDKAMPQAYHDLGLKLYSTYLVVGGMPEAVSKFVETDSYLTVQEVLSSILNEYIADMAKYAPHSTSIKIRSCYNSIPAQLAKENKKFQYKVVQKGGTASIFGEAIDWLLYAGIVLKCHNVEHGEIPLKAYVDLSSFKLYMGDIGLLTLSSAMPIQTLLSPMSEENTFVGGITENYVAQVLTTKQLPTFYWNSDGKAEVDFVLQIDGKVVPLEVKSGTNVRSRSLNLFMKKYNSPYAIRLSKKNFGFENDIKSVPLYAAFCL